MTQEAYQDFEPGYIKDLSYLYDWLFHYNHHTGFWAAIPRDTIAEYFNNYSSDKVLRSKSLATLQELLHSVGGDITKL